MRRLLLSLALLCVTLGMMAQRTINGTIKDSQGEPVYGAAVMIQGTTKGVATDFDGKYSISVNNGDVLEISGVGFKKVVKSVDKIKGSTFDVKMQDDAEMLGDVVVEVGYTVVRAKDVTGSATHVNADKLTETKTVSVDEALKGRSSGVQVTASSGQPGAKSNIRIRGTSTLTGNSQPLYVVDGLPIGGGKRGTDDNPLASINPEDIESMEILKDASATAIYGSRAANGVIMITTKKGKEGKDGNNDAKVTYSGSVSVSSVSDKLDLMDLGEYSKFYTDPTIMSAFKQSDVDKELKAAAAIGGKGTDWQDEIFRTAVSHQHQVGVNGGNKETQFAVSMGYMKQNGVIINTDFQRFNGRVNLDNQTKKWLRTGISLAYTRIDQTKQAGFELSDDNSLGGIGVGGATDEALYVQSLISKPSTAPTDFDGEYAMLGGDDQEIKTNPVREAYYSPIFVNKNNVIGNIYAKIDFIQPYKTEDKNSNKTLSWRNDFGIDHSNVEESQFTPRNNNASNQQLFIDRSNDYWRFSSVLSYGDKVKDHKYDVMVGYEAWKASWNGIETSKSDYLDDKTFIDKKFQNTALGEPVDIAGYKGAQSMMSAFARLNYNYKEKYLITATGRADGSSTLAPKDRWGFFPSFALGWRLSEEDFLASAKDSGVINDLKLRIGYGQTGNAGTDMGYISSYSQRNGAKKTGLVQGTWVNPDLIWETNWQVNAGIDLNMIRNRISMVFDVFYKQNNDLIVKSEPGQTLASRGDSWLYTAVPNINAGSMRNVGMDLSLTTTNIEKKFESTKNTFRWTTDFNFSIVRNKVLELQSDSLPLTDDTYFRSVRRSYCRSEVGHAPGLFYGYKTDGIIQNTAQLKGYDKNATIAPDAEAILQRFDGTDVGDYNYVDINSDGKIDVNDKTFIGDPNPDFTFGMGNTLTYGPWSLSIFVAGTYGNDVYNLLRSKIESMDRFGVNQLNTVLDYARVVTNPDGTKYVENSNTNMPRPNSTANGGEDAQTISDRYVEDGSFLRIQNIGLSYNLPKNALEKIKMSNMRITFNVQNIATFTKYSGMNPEVANGSAIAQGIDLGGYPLPRQYVLGVNFEF
ncbi:MAG: TonB-dependent receptor [Paludibacteraceae bacterium]|nr:TonB-dependent receptor [Paludibacteraceae bacterium]